MTLKADLLTDLDCMFDTDEFADEVTYTNRYGYAKAVNGIYDAAFEALNPATGSVEATAPQIQVKSADVAGVRKNETILREGTTWYITGIHPDGTGVTILVLSEDAI